MLGITGYRSAISKALIELLPEGEDVEHAAPDFLPLTCDRYFLASGYLAGRSLETISDKDTVETWRANFYDIARLCDKIIARNARARICVIGSESGISGSFDGAYAGAKAALHQYVENKRLEHPGQQLVAIAPTIIWDSGMTQRRPDLDRVAERGRARRLGRWLAASEVAALAHFLLYVDRGYVTNTVVRIHGGNW